MTKGHNFDAPHQSVESKVSRREECAVGSTHTQRRRKKECTVGSEHTQGERKKENAGQSGG